MPAVSAPDLPPADVFAAEARARERYRRAVWAALTSVASRGLAMLLLVLGVHLTSSYLGSTRFGLWATFASMTAMLSLLDMGVGNALVNRVAHAAAQDRPDSAVSIITGGAGLLAFVGLASALGLLALALALPWGPLLKLDDAALAAEARQSAAVFAVLFGVNLFSSGMLRILAGQQRLHEANVLSACAAGIACLCLWWASRQLASVPWLLLATFGIQTLAGLMACMLLLRRRLIVLKGAWSAMAVERPHLLRVGSLFVLLQLGTMLGWGGDTVILAVMKGAAEVAVFAVALRLFQFASQPFAMMNTPLWAAYADATARRDVTFVRQTLKRSFLVSLFGSAFVCSALFVAGPSLIAVWTHGSIVVPTQVLALLAIWTVLETGGNAFGIYLNGVGIVREQVWVVGAFCLVALPLKLYAASQAGASGLVAASIVVYVIAVIGLYATVFRQRVLNPFAAPIK